MGRAERHSSDRGSIPLISTMTMTSNDGIRKRIDEVKDLIRGIHTPYPVYANMKRKAIRRLEEIKKDIMDEEDDWLGD